MNFLLLFLLFQQPEKLTCTAENNKTVLRCTSEDREGFPLEKKIKTPASWRKHLADAQDGSTMDVEQRGGKLCLIRVFELGGFERESVNGERPINACVRVKR